MSHIDHVMPLIVDDIYLKISARSHSCPTFDCLARDIEFDLEKDQFSCRLGLGGLVDGPWSPSAVKRVTDIFDKPVFFGPDGPNASDVRQGALGDCWFLAALSAISTIDGLVEKICVAVSPLIFLFVCDGLIVVIISVMRRWACMASCFSATVCGKQ